MFITLKCPPGDGAMEQVVARGASPGQQDQSRNRARPSRRPACISCQTKKLRCTGPKGDCDRCRARVIPCVFPTSSAKNNRSASSSSVQGPSRQESGAQPLENALEPGDRQQEPTVSASDSNNTNGSLEGNPSDMNFHNDMTQLLMDMEDLDRSHQMENPDPGNQYPGDLGDMSHLQYNLLPPNLAHNLPAWLTNETWAQQAIQDLLPMTDAQNRIPTPSNPANLDLSRDDSTSWNSSLGCPCIHSTVRVVQQLDDDDFRITALSLDQVVQLQKWIISQCGKPLDCPNCRFLPTVHTVLVIICDRLSEMFECISKRIKRANQRLSGQASSEESTESAEPCAADSSRNANCNPDLFSSEFQNTYSDEEQVHMIRVLLKLQLRNFRALLVRLDGVIQIAGSEARRSKVKSVMLRLGRAATEIDNALRVVLQFFVMS
ncbi:hypothetical protein VTN96DRAFT_1091 [Rasamsonia emersonii]